MLAGRLVREFGELADQLLEDRAHLSVADDFGVQVDVGELLGDQVEQAGLRRAGRSAAWKSKRSKMSRTAGENAVDVGDQVLPDVILVAHQLLHVQRRRVVEALAGLPEQERLGVHASLLSLRQLGEDGCLGGLQDAVEPAEDGEWQDDPAVLGLLVVPRSRSATDQMKEERLGSAILGEGMGHSAG